MRLEAAGLLHDIVQAGQSIVDFTELMDLAAYQRDLRTQAAVERHFTIIGEAMRRLAQLDPEVANQFPGKREIISFRNILVHAYDKVEAEVVWGITQRNLPGLLELARTLLERG